MHDYWAWVKNHDGIEPVESNPDIIGNSNDDPAHLHEQEVKRKWGERKIKRIRKAIIKANLSSNDCEPAGRKFFRPVW